MIKTNKCIICGSYVESKNSDYCNNCKPRKGYEVDILKEQLYKLKQELIESKKTIEDLEVELFREKLDKERDDISLIQNCEKDKIEFAIEKLEKVKDKILSYEEIYYQVLRNGAAIPVFCVENFRVRRNIDQQIEELKKEKNDYENR